MSGLSNPLYLGPICALGASMTWAIGSTGYSQLSKQYSVFSINFVRALIALPLFILSAFLVSGGLSGGIASYQSIRLSHWGWFTLSMISSYGLGDAFFLMSTRSLGVPGALAIASSYPVWTVLAGYLFSHEEISWIQGLGLFLTVGGIVTVILNGPSKTRIGNKFSWSGVILALATSVAWATNGFAVSRGGIDLPPPVGNTIRMILALFLSGCFGKIFTPQASIVLPQKEIARFFWVFVLEAFGGSYLYLYGLSHSPLAIGSTLSSLAPVISVPVALLFGIEKFAVYRTLGVISVVVGICFLVT